jgi:hypothetical protein
MSLLRAEQINRSLTHITLCTYVPMSCNRVEDIDFNNKCTYVHTLGTYMNILLCAGLIVSFLRHYTY